MAALPLSTRRLLFIAIMEAARLLDLFENSIDMLDRGTELDFDKMRKLRAMCESAVTDLNDTELQECKEHLHDVLNDIANADNKLTAGMVKEEVEEEHFTSETASAVNTVVADGFQFAEEEQHTESTTCQAGPDILESAGLQNTSGRNSMTAQHTE